MEIQILKVEKRDHVGKNSTSKLRKQGRIPGVCYGHGTKSLNLSLDTKELLTILKSPLGLNSLIKLSGVEDRTVFVQKLQRDPVKRNIIHVDFLHVNPNKSVQRYVPVEFVGKPEGTKTGGVLQITAREILVEALPGHIPHHVTIDVGPLQIGQSIHIKEVQLPKGTKAVYEQNFSICSMISLTEEQTAEAESTEATVTEAAKGTDVKASESQDLDDPKKKEDKASGEKK